MCSLDPETPTSLQVASATTHSIKIKWQYDKTASLIVTWKILFKETGKVEVTELVTDDVTKRDVNIDHLAPGVTYNIRLFAITTGDIASPAPAEINATSSKYMRNVTLHVQC